MANEEKKSPSPQLIPHPDEPPVGSRPNLPPKGPSNPFDDNMKKTVQRAEETMERKKEANERDWQKRSNDYDQSWKDREKRLGIKKNESGSK